jgi:hypothetical protein
MDIVHPLTLVMAHGVRNSKNCPVRPGIAVIVVRGRYPAVRFCCPHVAYGVHKRSKQNIYRKGKRLTAPIADGSFSLLSDKNAKEHSAIFQTDLQAGIRFDIDVRQVRHPLDIFSISA